MPIAPHKFDSDEQFLAYLAAVNPKYKEYPPDSDFVDLRREARVLHQRLQAELGPGISFSGDYDVQDATYHTGIFIPRALGVREQFLTRPEIFPHVLGHFARLRRMEPRTTLLMLKEAIPHFDELSVSEKLLLLEKLWDAVAAEPSEVPVHDWQKQALERRYQEYLQNPAEGSPWPEVRDRLMRAVQ